MTPKTYTEKYPGATHALPLSSLSRGQQAADKKKESRLKALWLGRPRVAPPRLILIVSFHSSDPTKTNSFLCVDFFLLFHLFIFICPGPNPNRELLSHDEIVFNDNGTLSTIPHHPLVWNEEMSMGNREDDIFMLPNIALLVSGCFRTHQQQFFFYFFFSFFL